MKNLIQYIKESTVAEKLSSGEGKDRMYLMRDGDDKTGRFGRCRNFWEMAVPRKNAKRTTVFRQIFFQENKFNKWWDMVLYTDPDPDNTRALYTMREERGRCIETDESAFEKCIESLNAAVASSDYARKELSNLLRSATEIASGKGGWKTLRNADLSGLNGTVLFQVGKELPFIVTSHADDFSTFTGISIDKTRRKFQAAASSVFYYETERDTDTELETSGWKFYTADESKIHSVYETLKKAEHDFRVAMATISRAR